MEDPLTALTNASVALLDTTRLHPSPFPPPTTVTPSAHLASSRALNTQLQEQLNNLHITAVARRKAAEVHQQQQQSGRAEDPRTRQQRLESRLDELRAEVDEERGNRRIREGVINALNQSFTVNSVLSRSALPAATPEDQAISGLLQHRDSLALDLLAQQKETADLQRTRAATRRKLVAVNRANASMSNELERSSESKEVEQRVVESMSKEDRRRWDRIRATTLRQLSGHAIIRNVFQLVVVESGVEWYDPEAAASLLSLSSPTDDPEAPMDTDRLLHLMLSAGDGVEREWDALARGEAPPGLAQRQVEEGSEGSSRGGKRGRGGKGRGGKTPAKRASAAGRGRGRKKAAA